MRNNVNRLKRNRKIQPKVSVIIPVYNKEEYIRECLDSILGQSLKEIEVVLVDDGSTDLSQKVIDEYATKDPRIISLQQENQGSGPARNNGIRHANGEFVIFMDPDDYYPDKDVLEKLYRNAVEHGVKICGGSLSCLKEGKLVTKFYWDMAYGNTFDEAGIIEYKDWQFDVGYTRYIFDRKMLVENDVFFPAYRRCQDPPFFVRAMITAGRFYAIPDITYCYRQTPKNIPMWDWPESTFCDMLHGMMDMLNISREAGLSKVHLLTIRKLEEYGYYEAIVKYLQKGSPKVFKLVLEMFMAMDVKLIDSYEKFGERIKDDVFVWKLIPDMLMYAGNNSELLSKTEKFRLALSASVSSVEELDKLCEAIGKVCKGLDVYGKSETGMEKTSEEQVLAGKTFMVLLAAEVALNFGNDGAKKLLKYMSCEILAHALAWKNWDNMSGFYGQLLPYLPEPIKGNIKPKLALYYHRLTGGGVERAMSLLIPIFMKMGYEIVVITQDPPSPNDYELPASVKREVIYDYRRTTPDKFFYRFQSWREIIERNDIGLVIYEAWIEKVLTWDIFFIRLMGTRCLIQTHGIASYAVIRDWNWWAQLIDTYRLAESIVVLSEANRFFWSAYHDNVYYVPNPVGRELTEIKCEPKHNHVLIWVGRLSMEKRPWLAIEIMAEVVRQVPDAKLLMVGGEDKGKGYRVRSESLIKEYGLENNVELCGFTTDVGSFWRQASVHLFTTLFEGFPMVLMEAKGYGMPTVMTDLPYLAMSKPGTGVIGIPNMDVKKAAEAVVRLLTDKAAWQNESEAARRDFESFTGFDYAGAWKPILEGKRNEKSLDVESGKIMLRTLAEHHLLGLKNVKDQHSAVMTRCQSDIAKLSEQVVAAKAEIEEIKKKSEEKIGALNKKLEGENGKIRKASEDEINLLNKKLEETRKNTYKANISTVYWGALKYIHGADPEKDIIVDDDPSLWGTMVSGLLVCSPEALKDYGRPFNIKINKHNTISRIKELGYAEKARLV